MIFEKTIKKIMAVCIGLIIIDDTTNPPLTTIQMIVFLILLFLALWGLMK